MLRKAFICTVPAVPLHIIGDYISLKTFYIYDDYLLSKENASRALRTLNNICDIL